MTNSHAGCTRIGLVFSSMWDLVWKQCGGISSLTLHSARVHIPRYFMYRTALPLAYQCDGVPTCVFQVREMREGWSGHQPTSRDGRVRPPLPTTDTTHVWATSTKGESVNIVGIGNMTHVSLTPYDTCLLRSFDWLYEWGIDFCHIYAWQTVCEGTGIKVKVCICPVPSYFSQPTHVSLCS